MHNLLTAYKSRSLSIRQLPVLPAILNEMAQAIERPSVSMEQIAMVIGKDQGLAAKVLSMVNSPAYGFPGRIARLQHALVLLGIDVIHGLIISSVVFNTMNKGIAGLWKHSQVCSLCCAEIARATGQESPKDFAVAGLLHDLGKAVIVLQLPEAKREMDKLVVAEDMSVFEAEVQVLGFGHDRVNEWLAEYWRLPLILREGMAHHHKPLSAQHYPNIASAVQLGDFFSRIFDYGDSDDTYVNHVDPAALECLGINRKRLQAILDAISAKIFHMYV